jgi:hypothetical protein
MASKVQRHPLAFGMTKWGPLPDTTSLFLFWGGPGDGLYLTSDNTERRISHPTASGTYDTPKQAQSAVDAFIAAYEAKEK